jgi:AcrR family transcriptional regulator
MKSDKSTAAARARHGKESEETTESRLLDAAEKLFADYGYDATNVRLINSLAQVNSGAIHYYFGTKEDLFRRVMLRRSSVFAADRLARLARCSEGPGRPPLLSQIIESYVKPYTNPALGSPEARLRFARLRARLMIEPRAALDSPLGEVHEAVGQRFVEALAGCLPQLPRDEVQFRYLIMWSALNTLSAALDQAALGKKSRDGKSHPMVEFEKTIPRLVESFTALFRAPSTKAPARRRR